MINIRPFQTTEALIQQAEKCLRETLATPGNLMLSGGTTPYVIYNRLALSPCPVHPDRKLFLSDERMQPLDSESNNAHNLKPFLDALKCTKQFVRVNTELSVEQATDQFETDIKPLNTIDLGFLGMGSDGHTAGFFTTEQARLKNGPLALYTDRPDGMQGITVTPSFLKRVKKIILLVTGESKRDIINTLLKDPQSIPAGIALTDHPDIELWTDIPIP